MKKNKFESLLSEFKIYLIIIVLANILISLFCYYFNKNNTYNYFIILLFTLSSTIFVILVDGIIAKIIHSLPEVHFDYKRKIFQKRKYESKLFKIIKIHKWKDSVPEIGKIACDFGKNKIEEPNNLIYVKQFIKETCIAELVHFYSMIFGVIVIFILPINYWLWIGLFIFIINFILNLPSLVIQRYNRPRLIILLNRINKKAID